MRLTWGGLVAGALVVAAPLQAQHDCLQALAWPSVGRWSDYAMAVNGKASQLHYAAVGRETRDGVRLTRIEMRTSAAGGVPSVYQMLVPGGPSDIAGVQEVIIKSGDRPAMKMNGMMLGMVCKQLEENSLFTSLCDQVTFVGEETVKVPAGSFQSLHFHNDTYHSDTWISEAVPFALVKTVTPRHRVELQAIGAGATSAITETPREMMGSPAPSR